MEPKALLALVTELAAGLDASRVGYVLGFPEGGLPPAFALAQVLDRPLVLSTRLRLPLAHVITFEEPYSTVGKTHYIHGLGPGDRVVIMEDEITTGGTVLNAVRALRRAGVEVDAVATLLAIDDPRLWRAMQEEGVALHVRFRVPLGSARDHAERLGKPRPG
jgi:adenine/guanine phosphoribosyltransferase-like PRPP-binding protein